MESKKTLRKTLKDKLSRMEESLKIEKSKSISLKLYQFLQSYSLECVGGYAPLPNEVHWHYQWNSEIKMAFPALEDQKMVFRQCDLKDLVLDNFNGVELKVPPRKFPLVTPELLIIPGLGFNQDLARLGRGKGFYDQYLTDYPGIKVGICFQEQFGHILPMEEHDIFMDYVITDE